MHPSNLPFASIQNESLRLDYLTSLGPRIVGLYVNGVSGNLLAETPEMHWPTPHGEYYLHGGHRLWTAPEDPFYTCPEENVEVIKQGDTVSLRGPVDASGLQKEITIKLENNRVHLSHRVTWHGKKPVTFAAWAITQLRLGGMAILPLSRVDGLLPDRNFILWPYSELKDQRLELHDDLILLHGRGKGKPFKIGNFNPKGWIACTLGEALFIKRFTPHKEQHFPDMGCNVEAYVGDSSVELETLGALIPVNPGASILHEETWEIIAGEFPATLECARQINEQLSQSETNGAKNGEQDHFSKRFSVGGSNGFVSNRGCVE